VQRNRNGKSNPNALSALRVIRVDNKQSFSEAKRITNQLRERALEFASKPRNQPRLLNQREW
jgi:hypothetical protein